MTTNNAVNSSLSGTTGTGKFVGSTSPSITTGINDTNGNGLISISAQASSVNYLQFQNAITGNFPIITSIGSDSNIPLALNAIGTGGVIVKGTGTNDSASSGNIGEIITSQILFGSAINMTNSTATDITSISLTAGDWDLWGNAYFNGGTNLSTMLAWVSATSATIPDQSLRTGGVFTAGIFSQMGISCAPIRVSINTTTTVYLSGFTTNTAGTTTGSGKIYARRRR